MNEINMLFLVSGKRHGLPANYVSYKLTDSTEPVCDGSIKLLAAKEGACIIKEFIGSVLSDQKGLIEIHLEADNKRSKNKGVPKAVDTVAAGSEKEALLRLDQTKLPDTEYLIKEHQYGRGLCKEQYKLLFLLHNPENQDAFSDILYPAAYGQWINIFGYSKEMNTPYGIEEFVNEHLKRGYAPINIYLEYARPSMDIVINPVYYSVGQFLKILENVLSKHNITLEVQI